jgi:hypothetical protein
MPQHNMMNYITTEEELERWERPKRQVKTTAPNRVC